MVHLEVITRGLGFLLSLTAIFFSVQILTRLAGKFKRSITFLLIAIVFLLLINLAGILEIFYGFNINLIRAIVGFLITLMILFAVISLKSMINGINGKYKKK